MGEISEWRGVGLVISFLATAVFVMLIADNISNGTHTDGTHKVTYEFIAYVVFFFIFFFIFLLLAIYAAAPALRSNCCTISCCCQRNKQVEIIQI